MASSFSRWHPLVTSRLETQCAVDRAGFPFLSPPSLLPHPHPPAPNAREDPRSVCIFQGEAGTGLGSFPIEPYTHLNNNHPHTHCDIHQNVRTTVSDSSPGLHALRPFPHHAANVSRSRHQLLLPTTRAPDGYPTSEPQGSGPLSTGFARRAATVPELLRSLTSRRGHASVWRCRPAHIRDAERHP